MDLVKNLSKAWYCQVCSPLRNATQNQNDRETTISHRPFCSMHIHSLSSRNKGKADRIQKRVIKLQSYCIAIVFDVAGVSQKLQSCLQEYGTIFRSETMVSKHLVLSVRQKEVVYRITMQ